MQSDSRMAIALDALAQPIAEFRSAVEAARTQARAFRDAQQASPASRAEHAAAEFGLFGNGRLNHQALAQLIPGSRQCDAAEIAALGRALQALDEVAGQGDDCFVAEVTPTRKLGATIDHALARAGRAFGAIVLAELIRAGRYDPALHDMLLEPAEFRSWNRVERRFTPPLVVLLDGVDLHSGALTDFADGRAKLVLVVRGPTAPAPLARCITPGTFVMQSHDGSGIERVGALDGPAIVAMVPKCAMTFSHDPGRGAEAWQRLTIGEQVELPREPLGGISVWQMAEDVRLLTDLARTPFAVPVRDGHGSPAIGAADAVDRVTQWLLGEAGLQDGAQAPQ